MKFYIKRGSFEDAAAQLEIGLENLSLEDNFHGFTWTGTIPANSEVLISNKMDGREIPSGFIVTMVEGTPLIVKGTTPWDATHVSLLNIDATNDAIATVRFLK